jgi:hypothetical protein
MRRLLLLALAGLPGTGCLAAAGAGAAAGDYLTSRRAEAVIEARWTMWSAGPRR